MQKILVTIKSQGGFRAPGAETKAIVCVYTDNEYYLLKNLEQELYLARRGIGPTMTIEEIEEG